jgi:hypothetical protein
MKERKPNPARDSKALQRRIEDFFESTKIDRINEPGSPSNIGQSTIHQVVLVEDYTLGVPTPDEDLTEFMDQVALSLPFGDVYLFGGILRDLALYGVKGFDSDVDLVVDGSIDELKGLLSKHKAERNKFGGYRLKVGRGSSSSALEKYWDIDIWEAKNTWAFQEGHVQYDDITSLLQTTITNWDSILMNWRTKAVITREDYFQDIRSLYLDMVLAKNPNKLGMAVRVFRYLTTKNARKFSFEVLRYLVATSKAYSYEDLFFAEKKSYGEISISKGVYKTFGAMQDMSNTLLMAHYHEQFVMKNLSIGQVLGGQFELFD